MCLTTNAFYVLCMYLGSSCTYTTNLPSQSQALVLRLDEAAELIDTGKAIEYGRMKSRARLNKLNAAAMAGALTVEDAAEDAEEAAQHAVE